MGSAIATQAQQLGEGSSARLFLMGKSANLGFLQCGGVWLWKDILVGGRLAWSVGLGQSWVGSYIRPNKRGHKHTHATRQWHHHVKRRILIPKNNSLCISEPKRGSTALLLQLPPGCALLQPKAVPRWNVVGGVVTSRLTIAAASTSSIPRGHNFKC